MKSFAAKVLISATALFAGTFAHAASKESQSQSQKAKGGGGGVPATVVTDGALVYAAPDEDASILAQLPVNQHIRVSKGTTSGVQRFHKIALGKKIGYIDDIDISVGGAPSPQRPPPRRKKSEAAAAEPKDKDEKKKKAAEEKKRRLKEMAPKDPMYFTRFVGVSLGAMDYNESINGVSSQAGLAVYGLKITGPDVIIKGPVMDINLLIHYGAPPYYNNISAIQPSGFAIFLDGMFMLPIKQGQDYMFYFSAGPLLMYSKYSIVNTNRVLDLQQLGLGLDGALGAGFRVGKVGFKLEGKYYLLKQPDKALLAAVQIGF